MKIKSKLLNLRASRLAKDSLFQFFLNSIGAAISFLQLPLFLNLMGGQGFGELVLVQTIVSIFSTLTLIQFFQGMMKFAPNSTEADDITRVMLKFGLLNELLSLFLVLILSSFLYPRLSLKFPSIYILDPSLIIFIAVATSLSLGQTLPTFLRLINKYQHVVWWTAISSILRFLILLIFPKLRISSGHSIIIAFILPELIRFIGLILLVPKGFLFSKWKKIPQLKGIFSFSLTITVQEWFDLPVKQFDKLILSAFVQPVHVGTYQILKRIGLMMALVVSPFSTSFFHEFSDRVNSKNVQSAFSLFKKSIILFFSISTIIAIVLLSTEAFWVPRLFKEIEVGHLSILLIIITYVLLNSFNSVHSLLYVFQGIRESLLITLLTNIFFFLSAFFLGYHFTTNGLIISFSLQVILIIFFKLLIIRKKMSTLYADDLYTQ